MDKFAFVTGANRGLGNAFTHYLATRGYKVFAGIRNLATPDGSLKLLRGITPIELDVTNDEDIMLAAEKVRKVTKKIHILINNVGVNSAYAPDGRKERVCHIDGLNRKLLNDMYNINAVSSMMMVKYFKDLMADNSFIINISSTRASFHDEYENLTANYGYRMSKIALNMFTFASVADLPKGIKTFAADPGDVRTDMNPQGEFDALTQAQKIIDITENWNPDYNGRFIKYDGTFYPL